MSRHKKKPISAKDLLDLITAIIKLIKSLIDLNL